MMQRIRTAVCAAGLVALATGTAWADTIAVFDTGTDANGRVLGFGRPDPHWQIVQVPAGSPFVPPSAAIVAAAHPAYIPNNTVGQLGSSWIAPGSDTDGFYAAGTYVYRTSFDLTGLSPATASLTGALASDDNVLDILVNGVSLGITGGGFQNMNTTFTISAGFVDGPNTLDIVVRNAAAGPHGLRVRIDGTADPASQPDTTAPVFDGLTDVTFEYAGSPIALDAAALGITATDEVDGAVAVTLSPSAVDGLGEHAVTATAADAAGNVATRTFTVSLVDTAAPVFDGVADVTVECTGSAIALDAAAVGITATDGADGTVAVTLSPSAVDGLGEHVVTATATDAAGNVATAEFTVTVVDTAAPVVHSIGVSLESLRGNSSVEVRVTLTVEAEDACDPAPTSRIVAVSSSNMQNGTRRRHRKLSTSSATGELSVVLKAENRSRWNGRRFEILVETSDASGNATTSVVVIGGDDVAKASRTRGQDHAGDGHGDDGDDQAGDDGDDG